MIIELTEKINERLNGIVWGLPTVALILLTGVVITVGTGFFQLRYIRLWWNSTAGSILKRKSRKSDSGESKNRLSPFQSACTALAATIGTGNIAGVATAVAVGGPGAVFWMWVSAFFGMMTAYAENVLGIRYRRKNEKGEWCGGPMYYIGDGIKRGKTGKILAVLFSVFCIFASFGIGNMTQANSIASALNVNFGADKIKCGTITAVLAGLVIVGGVSRLGKVTEKLVPVMSLFFMGASLVILIKNASKLPYVIESIVSGAFGITSVAGAGSGIMMKKAVSCGIKRGIFSNEAGLGSSAIVNSASDASGEVEQGMWGIFEVFFDTVVVCSLTAFVLLSSTCDAVSLEDALDGITREKEFVALCSDNICEDYPDAPLISRNPNPSIESASPSEKGAGIYTVRPENGKPFDICIKKDTTENFVHTNIISVRGVCVDEKSGALLENGDINSVVFEKVEGVQLVTCSFSGCFGKWAGKILALAIVLFAFSTLAGWSYYGVKAWEYLFGLRCVGIYKAIYVAFIVVGACMSLDLVWGISDTLNGLMALPNLAGLIVLSGEVLRITDNYLKRKKLV